VKTFFEVLFAALILAGIIGGFAIEHELSDRRAEARAVKLGVKAYEDGFEAAKRYKPALEAVAAPVCNCEVCDCFPVCECGSAKGKP
jgi:hypothetical protein